MNNKSKIISQIQKHAVEPYKSLLLQQVLPSIRLITNGKTSSVIGTTKLGGCPDLSQSIEWPKSNYGNQHLSFLGQINLKEITNYDESEVLPKVGMLYFFYNLDAVGDGTVLYISHTDLNRVDCPAEFEVKKKSFLKRLFTGREKQWKVQESSVDIGIEYDFHSWDSLFMEKTYKTTGTAIKPINAFINDAFGDDFEEETSETISNHHLLGCYQGIQNEYHELDFVEGGMSNFENLDVATLNEALKWKLLFQFDSDSHLDINIADGGRIFFFIHEDDLKNRNFEHVKISSDFY